jgi:hypothetical protein
VAGVPALEDETVALGIFLAGLWSGTAGAADALCIPHDPHDRQFLHAGKRKQSPGHFPGTGLRISITAIYTLLGVIVSVSNVGPNAANALSTHWIPNLIFFALFIVFAFSFFGMFELVLPPAGPTRPTARWIRADWAGSFSWP